MSKTVSTLAIVVLLGAGWVEHDALVRPAAHTHSEIPSSVIPTQTAPISAIGGHTVLRPKPVTMHFSVPTPNIIYSEK